MSGTEAGRAAAAPELVSVIIPTRGRPADVAACVATVLRCEDGNFEVVVADQNDDDATAQALAPLLADPRLRHLPTPTQGAAAARNAGLAIARGALFCFTDDDCRVPPEWVARMRARLRDADVVCGRVTVPPELRSRGWAASFTAELPDPELSFPRGYDWGIAANLGLRKSALEVIGGFDAAFSPGAPLKAGEEPDFLIRALRKGQRVRNAPEVELLHLGVREGAAVNRLRLGYVHGTAAALIKHARLGCPQAGWLWFRLCRTNAVDVARNLVLGRRPLGLRWLLAHLGGAWASLGYGVDPRTQLLVDWRTRAPIIPRRPPRPAAS